MSTPIFKGHILKIKYAWETCMEKQLKTPQHTLKEWKSGCTIAQQMERKK